MADLIPPMLIKLQADVNDLKVGLANAQSSLKGVDDGVKKASTGMTNFVGKLKQVGATMGVAFASQQVVQFAKDIVMAASDMNETMSKTAVIFGDGFGAVEKFANQAANTLGMSKKAALDASSTFALFGQSAGLAGEDLAGFSGDLVTLSADFASFYNTSPEEAITAIGAALRGESEPIRKYNILINEASLKQEAMRMGLINTTKGALEPQVRVLATQALILKQSSAAQGDFARTSDGAANMMRILSANMEDAKAKLGAGLLPVFKAVLTIMKPIISGLASFGSILANNAGSVTAFIVALTAMSAAWGIYTLVVKRAAIQQAILNLVQKANPIGIIITAVALLVAGMVKLFNSNETFRKAVITMAKAALTAFAAIIPMVGQVIEVIMKLTTGPLRLLLTALSHLPGVGKYAKAGLDIMNKGLDGISDFAKGAANKANDLIAKLDKVGTAADKAGKKTKTAVDGAGGGGGGKGGGGGLSEDAKKKLEKLKGNVKDIYKDMNDVIASAHEKAAELAETRNEKIMAANADYAEKVADLNKRHAEAVAEATSRYDERVLEIHEDYAKRTVELEKARNEKIADLQKRAQEKSAELTKAAADKQASIIQQSVDRLRSAFASKTGFDLAEAFGAGDTAGGLIDKLKASLTGAKDLQKNAAALAAKGYSQTFIEQVVKQGPEIGNKMAKSILSASDEQAKVLQDSFKDMETLQDTGLNDLAESMNKGANLATAELREAYAQVAVDLKAALATVDQELLTSMAEANANYAEAMVEAKSTRDAALADALKAFTDAKAKAQKDLDEGLAEAQKVLQEALLKAQKDYNDAIDKLEKDTDKKLQSLKDKLKEVAAQMAALGAAQAAAAALAAAPKPVYTQYGTPGAVQPGQAGFIGPVANTTINTVVNGINLTDPNATANQVANGIKYGTVVTITNPVAPAKSASDVIADRRKQFGYI